MKTFKRPAYWMNRAINYFKDRKSGFEQGYRKWGKYYLPRTATDPKQKAAQYMSPHLLTGSVLVVNRTHYNLCGQLAVIHALDKELEFGMQEFLEIDDIGLVVMNNNYTTHALHLVRFIANLGGNKYDRAAIKSGGYALKQAPEFADALEAGSIIISLVNIDPFQDGEVMGMHNSSRDVAHWIWVKAVMKTQFGVMVRVYNPFMNRNELYAWPIFAAAHQQTHGNTSRNLSVVAQRRSV